jgi:hypothetical protein
MFFQILLFKNLINCLKNKHIQNSRSKWLAKKLLLKKLFRQVRRAFNMTTPDREILSCFLTYLSPITRSWIWHLPNSRGCQDIIGSIPSVFLDKNIFKERYAKLWTKLYATSFLSLFFKITLCLKILLEFL